jgi:hypothetical protein
MLCLQDDNRFVRSAAQQHSMCQLATTVLTSLPRIPTKAALGHSRHADFQDSTGKSAHAPAVQNFKFEHHAKHKGDD